MKQFKITVNGKTYDVAVEETGSTSAPAAVAAPAASVTGSQGAVTYAYYTDAACTAKIDAPKNVGTYYVKATVAADANFGSASAMSFVLFVFIAILTAISFRITGGEGNK